MALDKVVDSSLLDANLTTIADAIRAKGGTTAELAFPAGFAEAIANLETGGALPAPLSKVSSGKFTLASDVTEYYPVEHGMGTTPSGFVVFGYGLYNANFPKKQFASFIVKKTYTHNDTEYKYQGTVYSVTDSGSVPGYTIRSDDLSKVLDAQYIRLPAGTNYALSASRTYIWVALKLTDW